MAGDGAAGHSRPLDIFRFPCEPAAAGPGEVGLEAGLGSGVCGLSLVGGNAAAPVAGTSVKVAAGLSVLPSEPGEAWADLRLTVVPRGRHTE